MDNKNEKEFTNDEIVAVTINLLGEVFLPVYMRKQHRQISAAIDNLQILLQRMREENGVVINLTEEGAENGPAIEEAENIPETGERQDS